MPIVAGTRVTCFLPINNSDEVAAATRVISEISRRYHGATHSLFQPSAFRGYWVQDGSLVLDEVSLVIVDVPHAPDDPVLLAGLESLKASIFEAYRVAGSPQDEVWLTALLLLRIA